MAFAKDTEDFFGFRIAPNKEGLFNITEVFEHSCARKYDYTWEKVLEEVEKNGLLKFLGRVLPGVELYRRDEETGHVWVQYPIMLDFLRSYNAWCLWKSTRKIYFMEDLRPESFNTLYPMVDTTKTHMKLGRFVDHHLFGVWLSKADDCEYYEIASVLACYDKTWIDYARKYQTFDDLFRKDLGDSYSFRHYYDNDDGDGVDEEKQIYAHYIVACNVLSYCDVRVRVSILLLLTPEPYLSRMLWKSSATWRTSEFMSSFCRRSFCRERILSRIFGSKATVKMSYKEVGMKKEALFTDGSDCDTDTE